MENQRRKIKMIHSLASLMILFCSYSMTYGQTSEELFIAGNEAYEKNRYGLAIENYEKIHEAGQRSSDLYLNLGNAYFNQDNYAKAILAYERGLRLSPNDKSILANLEITRDQLASDVIEVPDFILLRTWRSFCLLFNSTIWSIFQFLCLFASAFLFWKFYKDQLSFSNRRFFTLFGILLLAFVIFFLAANTNDQLSKAKFAILMEEASLHEGADDRSDKIEELYPGNKIRIIDQIDDYYKVRLANQSIGWVDIGKLELI